MKNIIIISCLFLLSGVSFAKVQSCSTGFACPLDKLRAQEYLIQQQKLVDEIKKSNHHNMFKMNKFEGHSKEYNDLFQYTKPKN